MRKPFFNKIVILSLIALLIILSFSAGWVGQDGFLAMAFFCLTFHGCIIALLNIRENEKPNLIPIQIFTSRAPPHYLLF